MSLWQQLVSIVDSLSRHRHKGHGSAQWLSPYFPLLFFYYPTGDATNNSKLKKQTKQGRYSCLLKVTQSDLESFCTKFILISLKEKWQIWLVDLSQVSIDHAIETPWASHWTLPLPPTFVSAAQCCHMKIHGHTQRDDNDKDQVS